MTIQPASPQSGNFRAEQLLFSDGPRLGWVFRDRRQFVTPYGEPQPDSQTVAGQVVTRRARADRAWRFSLRWVARPLLPAGRDPLRAGSVRTERDARSERLTHALWSNSQPPSAAL